MPERKVIETMSETDSKSPGEEPAILPDEALAAASPADQPVIPATPTLNYASTNPTRWVRISTYATPLEANLAQLALDNAGIRTQIAARTRAASVYGIAPANMEILVMADDEAAARNVLTEIIQNRKARMERRHATCPVCGNTDSVPAAAPRWNSSHVLELSIAAVLTYIGLSIGQVFLAGALFIFVAVLLIDIARRIIHPPKTWRQGIGCQHCWLPGAADDLLDDDDEDEPAAAEELDTEEPDDQLDDPHPDAEEPDSDANDEHGSPS
jgi:hypothetical protein